MTNPLWGASKWMQHTIFVRAYTGVDDYGEETYVDVEGSVTYYCRITVGNKEIIEGTSKRVIRTATIYLLTKDSGQYADDDALPTIKAKDLIFTADGEKYVVSDVTYHQNYLGINWLCKIIATGTVR